MNQAIPNSQHEQIHPQPAIERAARNPEAPALASQTVDSIFHPDLPLLRVRAPRGCYALYEELRRRSRRKRREEGGERDQDGNVVFGAREAADEDEIRHEKEDSFSGFMAVR